MNLPNSISLIRLLSVPLIICLILSNHTTEAFFIFILAAVSDALDGILARAMKTKTTLGAYLDPLADKALISSVFLTLSYEGFLPVWLSISVIFRDFLIIVGTVLLFILNKPFQIIPLRLSKMNTVIQLSYILWVLGHVVFPSLYIESIDCFFILCVACTTLISGAAYVRVWSRYLTTSHLEPHRQQK